MEHFYDIQIIFYRGRGYTSNEIFWGFMLYSWSYCFSCCRSRIRLVSCCCCRFVMLMECGPVSFKGYHFLTVLTSYIIAKCDLYSSLAIAFTDFVLTHYESLKV